MSDDIMDLDDAGDADQTPAGPPPTDDQGPVLHDREAEKHVLSCLLLDPSLAAQVSPEVFHLPENRLVFLSVLRVGHGSDSVALDRVAADLSDRGQWHQVGEWPYLFEVEARDRIPTTAHFRHYADRLQSLHDRRAALAHAQATLRSINTGQALPEALPARVAAKFPLIQGRIPSSFHLLAANDASSLLGNRYLNRGDGLVISGQSGCGKSSMQTQMAEAWALGEDFHGIRPSCPLKSLIIQSEDSDGDIAEAWHSIRHVRSRTPEQIAKTDERVRVVTDRVNRGQRFIQALRLHVAAFKPDLVWINPLQAFMDGDVTSSKDIGAFLREGLNGLNEPASFGIVLIHHTTKPPTGKDRHDRLWHEQMYDMAGGAEIINWARAIISLKPLSNPGEFCLRLAKRGRRAGVTREVEQGVGTRQEPVTEIGVRHAKGKLPSGVPVIYWEAMPLPANDDAPAKPSGPKEKYHFEDYATMFPGPKDKPIPYGECSRILTSNGVPPKSVQACLKRWEADTDLECIREQGQANRWRRVL